MTPESTPATQRETVEGLMKLTQDMLDRACAVADADIGYTPSMATELSAIRAYAERLASPAEVVPPPGYAVVPLEPTKEMVREFCRADANAYNSPEHLIALYRAMLAAAPVASLSAAPVAPQAQEALQMIVDMCGWDEHGATEPTGQFEGLSWESIARMAMDIARAALRATKGQV